MSMVPASPKLYHLTHVGNLSRIVEAGVIWSDAKRLELALDCRVVGMQSIKQRRLTQLPVHCHPGTTVGQYVPFYFCPRSIMLYILHRGNHPELAYREGQRPIVHLQADLAAVVGWADEHHIGWAFSDRNAGVNYASFYASLDRLGEVNWNAIAATDFRNPEIKDGKQAEFLVFESFPWALVEKVGVLDQEMAVRVEAALAGCSHRPAVSVEPGWYY